jgi:hypothetical protein
MMIGALANKKKKRPFHHLFTKGRPKKSLRHHLGTIFTAKHPKQSDTGQELHWAIR